MPKRFRFIVNPLAGGRNKAKLRLFTEKKLKEADIFMEWFETTSAAAGYEKAAEAVAQGFDAVVAVGGDGTIHALASALVGTNTPLGILPLGSGNGYARMLGIPMSWQGAIETLLAMSIDQVDVGLANDRVFVNAMGFGFDAQISRLFAQSKRRGLVRYVKLTVQELFSYRSVKFTLKTQGSSHTKEAFLMAVCLGNQYGNNAFIAPRASLKDGLFDLSCIRKANAWNAAGLALRLFSKSLDKSPSVDYCQAAELDIIPEKMPYHIHLDGDTYTLDRPVRIRHHPQKLKVIKRL